MTVRARFLMFLLALTLLPWGIAHGQAPPIKIGILAEQTGFFSLSGQDTFLAARLFAEQLNARGGITGRPIELVLQDTASDPERAIIGARKLIEQDGVVAIVGLGLVSNALAVVPLVAQKGPVTLSISGAYLPAQSDRMVFAFNPSSPDLMQGGIRWLKQAGRQRVALLSTNDATGQVAERAYRILMRQYGLTSTGIEFFNPAAISAVAELTKIRESNPDAVVAWTVGRATGVVTSAAMQLGLADRPFVTTVGNISGAFLKQLGDIGADFYVLAVSKDLLDVQYLDRKDPQYQVIRAYREAFLGRYNTAPSAISGGTWDALLVLTEAIRKVGTDSGAIVRQMESMRGSVGVQGVYNFGTGRHRGLDAAVLVPVRIVKGQLVPAR